VLAAWRLGWILFGFAAATLVAALSHIPSAAAEDYLPPPAPSTDMSADDARARRTAAAADDLDLYDSQVGSQAGSQAGSPAPSDSFSDNPEPGETDPSREGGSEDGAAQDPAEAPVDGLAPSGDAAREPGDVKALGEAPAEVGDPALAGGDAPGVGDGAPALDPAADTRSPADRAPFENPPAGYDPLLFQVEDIDPVETDRRPARLSRIEPYDPVGVRIGSFVFFPEAEVGGLWTDNVLSSPHPDADVAAEMRLKGRLVSNWSTHALELRGSILGSTYDDFSSEDDRAWNAEARGRLDVTRRTNVQGLLRHDFAQEDRQAIDATRVGARPDVTTDEAALALNHRFNRLSVQLRGAVTDLSYSPADGVSNRDRDTLETREAFRASWEFKPTLSAFAEHELVQREKDAPPADGILRDSDGYRTRVGLDLGSTGAVLRGTISVGYGTQSPDDARLRAVDALLLDANLAWRPTEITSFLLTAQSDISDTTTTGSGGVASRTVGLEARHALRRYLIASAGLTYSNYDYDNVPLKEQALTSFAGLEYYASAELVLFARYQHLSFASNQADDYDTDEVRVGVRLRK